MSTMSVVYRRCCGPCPSDEEKRLGIDDPESADMKAHWSREMQARYGVFRCAWRRRKLCKGIVDYFGLSEDELRAAGWRIKGTEVTHPSLREVRGFE